MKLIDKDALVAEIERLISNGQVKLKESEECKDYESYVAWAERIATCINVLSLLDTLEVKEVDFEKMWKEYFKYRGDIATVNVKHIAKHFFELGLVSQLTWQDIRLISEIGEEFMNSEESDSCTDDETYYSAILNKFKQLGRGYKTQRQEIRELNKTSKSI